MGLRLQEDSYETGLDKAKQAMRLYIQQKVLLAVCSCCFLLAVIFVSLAALCCLLLPVIISEKRTNGHCLVWYWWYVLLHISSHLLTPLPCCWSVSENRLFVTQGGYEHVRQISDFEVPSLQLIEKLDAVTADGNQNDSIYLSYAGFSIWLTVALPIHVPALRALFAVFDAIVVAMDMFSTQDFGRGKVKKQIILVLYQWYDIHCDFHYKHFFCFVHISFFQFTDASGSITDRDQIPQIAEELARQDIGLTIVYAYSACLPETVVGWSQPFHSALALILLLC